MGNKSVRRSTAPDRLRRQDRTLTVAAVVLGLGTVVALVLPRISPSLTESTADRVKSTITVKGYVASSTTADAPSISALVAEAPTGPDAPFQEATPTTLSPGVAVSARPVVTVPPFPSEPIPPIVVPPGRAAELPVVVGLATLPTNLNPHVISPSRAVNASVASLVLPSVFRTGSRGEPIVDQDTMSSVKVTSNNPLVVSYVVRPDALWADGTPLGCNDFRLAWVAQSGRIPAFSTAVIPGYQRLAALGCSEDQRTITATFTEPDADWPWLFSGLVPAQPLMTAAKVTDLSAPLTAAESTALSTAWNTTLAVRPGSPVPVWSAGPFAIVSAEPSSVTLAPNPAYVGLTKASRTVQLVSLSADKTIEAIRSGTVQAAELPGDPALVTAIRAGSGATLTPGLARATEELVFNFRNPVLQQRGVREAIAACIEPVGLVQSRVTPVLPEAKPAGNRLLQEYEQGYVDNGAGRLGGTDVARDLLAKIGYSFGSDGKAAKSGRPLTLRVLFPSGGSLRQAVVDGLAQQCASAGISFIAEEKDAAGVAQALAIGDFDVTLTSTASQFVVDERLARYRINSSSNLGRYPGSRVATLSGQAAVELDAARRSQLLNDIDVQLWADVVSVPLYSSPAVSVSVTSLGAVPPSPAPAGLLAVARNMALSAV